MATKQKTRTVRTGPKQQKAAPKAVEKQTNAERAKEPRLIHTGTASATYRVGKKLTPLRTDYRAGDMTVKDHECLRDVVNLADKSGKFQRRNLDAGRLGRLYTMGFVKFTETGVADPTQIITITKKARDYVAAA